MEQTQKKQNSTAKEIAVLFLIWIALLAISAMTGCRIPKQTEHTIAEKTTEQIKDTAITIAEQSDTFSVSLPLADTTIEKQAEKKKDAGG